MEHGDDRFAAVVVEATGAEVTNRYFLPVTIRWTRHTALEKGPASVLSAVRRGPREGTLLDATAEPEFATALLSKIRAGEAVHADGVKIEFHPTRAFADAPLAEVKTVRAIDCEQSNSSVAVDNKYVLKILRRVSAGVHPEIELGRFLADTVRFQNAPALLGTVELVESDSRTALACVHALVENQGDAWRITGASLDRFIDEQRLLTGETFAENPETASMLQRMRQIGRRTAELHLALASRPDLPDFAPEPIAADDFARWRNALVARVEAVFELLRSRAGHADLVAAQPLLQHHGAVVGHIGSAWRTHFDGWKIRHHGDFHLGQVLIAKDDAYIFDFEGEPRSAIADRRSKKPLARDVAGFLRSIDYAITAAIDRTPNLNPRERPALVHRVHAWGDKLAAAFWEAYRETPGLAPLWPADEGQVRDLLDFFQLERAFYEIEGKLAGAPASAHIPIEATVRMLRRRGVVR
jgi:maltose alpha-D-glucosyltransferase/alpha-amylase